MSIEIIKDKCTGCGKCLGVCPGNLIYKDNNNKSFIRYKRDCWGCTACLKQCRFGAIRYYLGDDIGGKGGCLHINDEGDYLNWHILDKDKKKHLIRIDKSESNKY